MRASYSGNTSAFQAEARGSIPLARSISKGSSTFAFSLRCGYNKIIMKSAAATLLIFSFISIAVFGVFAMSHGAGHNSGSNYCIGAMAQGTDCPKEENALVFLAFHLNTFRSFSTAVFGQNILSLFLLAASLLLLAGIAIGKLSTKLVSLDLHSGLGQFFEPPLIHLQPQIIHWLALHENSPAAP